MERRLIYVWQQDYRDRSISFRDKQSYIQPWGLQFCIRSERLIMFVLLGCSTPWWGSAASFPWKCGRLENMSGRCPHWTASDCDTCQDQYNTEAELMSARELDRVKQHVCVCVCVCMCVCVCVRVFVMLFLWELIWVTDTRREDILACPHFQAYLQMALWWLGLGLLIRVIITLRLGLG